MEVRGRTESRDFSRASSGTSTGPLPCLAPIRKNADTNTCFRTLPTRPNGEIFMTLRIHEIDPDVQPRRVVIRSPKKTTSTNKKVSRKESIMAGSRGRSVVVSSAVGQQKKRSTVFSRLNSKHKNRLSATTRKSSTKKLFTEESNTKEKDMSQIFDKQVEEALSKPLFQELENENAISRERNERFKNLLHRNHSEKSVEHKETVQPKQSQSPNMRSRSSSQRRIRTRQENLELALDRIENHVFQSPRSGSCPPGPVLQGDVSPRAILHGIDDVDIENETTKDKQPVGQEKTVLRTDDSIKKLEPSSEKVDDWQVVEPLQLNTSPPVPFRSRPKRRRPKMRHLVTDMISREASLSKLQKDVSLSKLQKENVSSTGNKKEGDSNKGVVQEGSKIHALGSTFNGRAKARKQKPTKNVLTTTTFSEDSVKLNSSQVVQVLYDAHERRNVLKKELKEKMSPRLEDPNDNSLKLIKESIVAASVKKKNKRKLPRFTSPRSLEKKMSEILLEGHPSPLHSPHEETKNEFGNSPMAARRIIPDDGVVYTYNNVTLSDDTLNSTLPLDPACWNQTFDFTNLPAPVDQKLIDQQKQLEQEEALGSTLTASPLKMSPRPKPTLADVLDRANQKIPSSKFSKSYGNGVNNFSKSYPLKKSVAKKIKQVIQSPPLSPWRDETQDSELQYSPRFTNSLNNSSFSPMAKQLWRELQEEDAHERREWAKTTKLKAKMVPEHIQNFNLFHKSEPKKRVFSKSFRTKFNPDATHPPKQILVDNKSISSKSDYSRRKSMKSDITNLVQSESTSTIKSAATDKSNGTKVGHDENEQQENEAEENMQQQDDTNTQDEVETSGDKKMSLNAERALLKFKAVSKLLARPGATALARAGLLKDVIWGRKSVPEGMAPVDVIPKLAYQRIEEKRKLKRKESGTSLVTVSDHDEDVQVNNLQSSSEVDIVHSGYSS